MFGEFIRHYRKMDDSEIVADVQQSMDDLESLATDGKSFGAKMVRWSCERIEKNRINGSKGGRPRKTQSTTAAGESAAPKSDSPEDGGSAASAGRSPMPPRAGGVSAPPKVSEPPTTGELYDFAEAARLNEADAREWWELCTERGWKDRSGKPIRNWKAACERYCARRAINRMANGET